MPLSPRSAGAAAAAAVSPVPGSKMAPGTRAASARPPPRWRPEVASRGRKLLRPAGNGFTRPEVASLGRKWLPLPDGCLRQSGAGFFCVLLPRVSKILQKGAKLLAVKRIGFYHPVLCAQNLGWKIPPSSSSSSRCSRSPRGLSAASSPSLSPPGMEGTPKLPGQTLPKSGHPFRQEIPPDVPRMVPHSLPEPCSP